MEFMILTHVKCLGFVFYWGGAVMVALTDSLFNSLEWLCSK